MEKSFVDVLAEFQGAAAQTTIEARDRFIPPQGDYHLQLCKKESKAATNQYGPYVQSNVTLKIVDPGEFQDREFTIVFLINKTKEGTMNYGGQNYVTLGGVLGGEPIADNNPVVADQLVGAACDRGDVIKARVFTTKKGYAGIEALSLESPIAA